jgi:hypothetical protein
VKRRDGEEELWRKELDAQTLEGGRDLEREGRRDGGGLGSYRVYIGGRGRGNDWWLMALTPLMATGC